jgi:hypothetical protein
MSLAQAAARELVACCVSPLSRACMGCWHCSQAGYSDPAGEPRDFREQPINHTSLDVLEVISAGAASTNHSGRFKASKTPTLCDACSRPQWSVQEAVKLGNVPAMLQVADPLIICDT